ncbi:nuclear transport factor 2 family protein [Halosegnis sp.]|uniref:nuclear transport factor 2 family protein n=1 Tax=Halosegnis sp. TaxID=2864959 RepID=UPI0035D49725
MDAAGTVRDYYEALRAGEPLYPYFHGAATTVKFGVGERLVGYETVRAGLRTQTATTTDWTVESSNLVVDTAEASGWFADEVYMAWTDTERDVRHEFDTRWSGSLLQDDGDWEFTGMHVSVPVRPGEGE